MSISPGLKYSSEDEFIQLFLIPLLRRLGFSLVVNYHGKSEFGKDLVFAELDRFGHVRYHGLQAKYEPSISLNEIEDLIRDGRQAYANQFIHPQTGTEERISSFYAVTAGSVGHEAAKHFFSSLLPLFGGNVRLLQGKDLVTLDRWAASSRAENSVATISGMLLELRYNEFPTIANMRQALQTRSVEGFPSWSNDRLRTDVHSSYLRQPAFNEFVPAENVLQYCHLAEWCNREMQLVAQGLLSPKLRVGTADILLEHLEELETFGGQIQLGLHQLLRTLGPIAPL